MSTWRGRRTRITGTSPSSSTVTPLLDGLQVILEATVPDGGLGTVHLHHRRRHPRRHEGGHDVLHGEDLVLVVHSDAGTQLRAPDVLQIRGDLPGVLQVQSTEADPCRLIGVGRMVSVDSFPEWTPTPWKVTGPATV
jgi:hypothetical protein